MNSGSDRDDDDIPLGTTEARALRRLVEPIAPPDQLARDDLWALRYRIQEPLGHGGMGDVFLARDTLLDRLVALKILRNKEESFVDERQLLREARAAARAEHERVARIYDVGTWEDQAFIAMEYVRGETLRAWMKTHHATARETTDIVRQLLDGLRALHERGLVHRDLKPENIMVTPDGTLRILDLGVARRVAITDAMQAPGEATGNTSLGVGVGTPGYMAPEQWHRVETDARVDLFAVGVIAYELVVGRAPFRGDTKRETREKTLQCAVEFDGPSWADVPATLKSIIRGALRADPDERFANVAEMVEALAMPVGQPPPLISTSQVTRSSEEGLPEAESLDPPELPPRSRTSSRRFGWLVAPAGLVLTVAAIGLIAFAVREREAAMPLPTRGMVQFRAARFMMGAEPAEIEAACRSYPKGCPPEVQDETPSRNVHVAAYELDEREITNEEFAEFLTVIGGLITVVKDDEHPYPRFVRYRSRPGEDLLLYDLWEGGTGLALSGTSQFTAKPGFERLPVTLVTWSGARLYCQSVAKRLPTEAEWEYAARGAEKRPFPWGAEPPTCEGVHIPSNGILPVIHADGCENDRTIPFVVMTAPQDRTAQGVYDLGGNVIEWVAHHIEDERTSSSSLPEQSPAITRGGSFHSSFLTRSTSRSLRPASAAGRDIGFRCAKSIHI
ncbi:MAG TPA: bifunctional serine/threonine-protein kinase/formylglycine-generating enzyme family protein [Polyangiaceae bacterium]|nr:bifunctional serine/threonine-protein kinase/formylglycine-generating enzyme family protein [Polyangiaceae bacterium]